MAVSSVVVRKLSGATGIPPATLGHSVRLLREAHLWPLSGKGGGKSACHVNVAHFTNLIFALAGKQPSDGPQTVCRLANLQSSDLKQLEDKKQIKPKQSTPKNNEFDLRNEFLADSAEGIYQALEYLRDVDDAKRDNYSIDSKMIKKLAENLAKLNYSFRYQHKRPDFDFSATMRVLDYSYLDMLTAELHKPVWEKHTLHQKLTMTIFLASLETIQPKTNLFSRWKNLVLWLNPDAGTARTEWEDEFGRQHQICYSQQSETNLTAENGKELAFVPLIENFTKIRFDLIIIAAQFAADSIIHTNSLPEIPAMDMMSR